MLAWTEKTLQNVHNMIIMLSISSINMNVNMDTYFFEELPLLLHYTGLMAFFPE